MYIYIYIYTFLAFVFGWFIYHNSRIGQDELECSKNQGAKTNPQDPKPFHPWLWFMFKRANRPNGIQKAPDSKALNATRRRRPSSTSVAWTRKWRDRSSTKRRRKRTRQTWGTEVILGGSCYFVCGRANMGWDKFKPHLLGSYEVP